MPLPETNLVRQHREEGEPEVERRDESDGCLLPVGPKRTDAFLYTVRFFQRALWPHYAGGDGDTLDVDVYEEGRDAYQIFVSIMRMANVTAEIEYGSSGGLIFKLLIVFGKIVATPRDLIGCASEAAKRAMVVNSNSPTLVYSGFFTKHMKKVTFRVKENPKTGQLGLDLVVGELKGDLGQPSLFEGIGNSESLVKKVLGALPGNCRIIVALDNTFVFNAREIKRVVKEKLNAGVTSIAFVFAKSSAYMGVYMDYHNRVPTEKINELEFASL